MPATGVSGALVVATAYSFVNTAFSRGPFDVGHWIRRRLQPPIGRWLRRRLTQDGRATI